VAMASALYGTVLGSMLGGWPTDRWGRKPTLTSIESLTPPEQAVSQR
jgi:MFS family permease